MTEVRVSALIGAGVAFVLASVLLMLHHLWDHWHDKETSAAKRESHWWLCYFQLSDVSNHETWAVVLLTNGLTLLMLAAYAGECRPS